MKFNFLLLCMLSVFTSNAQISQFGLLAHYSFDGHTLDSGPNSYHGLNFGGIFTEDANGNLNSSLRLNGIDGFVDLTAFAINFRDNLSELSIYFKVKFEESDRQTLLSLGSLGENIESNVFEFEYENDRIQIETESGNIAANFETELENSGEILDNNWHEILIYIKEDSVTYCRNGEVLYDGLYEPAETASDKLFIGCFNGTGDEACCFFGGDIDELQFYNRKLEKEELTVGVFNSLESRTKFVSYPNPSSDIITVSLENPKNKFIAKVFDSDGKIVLSKRLEGKDIYEINLPDAAGIYFLQILDSNGDINTEKIIKL